MNGSAPGTTWRILIVEDNDEIIRQLREVIPASVEAPDKIETEDCRKFSEAIDLLNSSRFDLLILDLKDESQKWFGNDDNPAGIKVFEELQKNRFIPVIFYTAFAHKLLEVETSFVRVVRKPDDDVTKVRDAVRDVLATRLPALAKRVEELQRSYMWEFVNKHWQQFKSPHEQADVAYLLARRLALSLHEEARKLARTLAGKGVPMADKTKVHPMEMYVPPPPGACRLAGDIVHGAVSDLTSDWMVLTPSCDFEQAGRLQNVLLAQCLRLSDQVEFKNWKANPSEENTSAIKALIGDNRKNAQSERFKYLPGTYFLADSIVDFQLLKTVTPQELSQLKVVGSLDSPYAEAVLARFARYFGRLGTPDLDKQVVLKRLEELHV